MKSAYNTKGNVQLPRVHATDINLELVEDNAFPATELAEIPTEVEDPCSGCVLNGTKRSLRTGFTSSYSAQVNMFKSPQLPFSGDAFTLRAYLAQR